MDLRTANGISSVQYVLKEIPYFIRLNNYYLSFFFFFFKYFNDYIAATIIILVLTKYVYVTCDYADIKFFCCIFKHYAEWSGSECISNAFKD